VPEDKMNEADNPENPDQPEPSPPQTPEIKPEAMPEATPEAAEPAPEPAAGGNKWAAAAPTAEGDTPENTESPETTEPDQPDELELAYGEVADLKDKLLRAMAETENIRRRGEREKADTRKYAIADFARDMLAVSDNLQRALAAVGDEARSGNAELAQLLEGIELTRKELQGHFDKHGIEEISPLGEKLDPNLHQAVVQLDDPDAAQGIVVQVMQPGYVIHGRLLRAAMVGVAKGAPAQTADTAADTAAAKDNDCGHNVDTQA
jgi:molecular chaperone GrpE